MNGFLLWFLMSISFIIGLFVGIIIGQIKQRNKSIDAVKDFYTIGARYRTKKRLIEWVSK
jgi:uncharacterized membrane-anchored protein YhcB (DUF1043 family)